MLIDVNQRNIEKVERIFPKKYIFMKEKYHSTSGSDMVIYMIRIYDFIHDL